MMLAVLARHNDLHDRRVQVIFTNTGREREETLFFVRELQERIGVPITWLEYRHVKGKPCFEIVNYRNASRNGEPCRQLIRAKKYLPNVKARFCTIELKIRTAKRYLRALDWDHWTNLIGFRGDETKRVQGAIRNSPKERWEVYFPLWEADVTKRDVARFWRQQNFDLALQNVNGKTPTGNCDGCFLKSEAIRAALARDEPEKFQWWQDMENLASKLTSNPAGATFIKDQPYAKLRKYIEDQGDWIFDEESALCQSDGGECI